MKKVRKKLIREKAVIALYQYLLTDATEEDIDNYLRAYYSPRMDDAEIELCKEIVFDVIENIEDYNQKIIPCLKKGWSLDRLSKMEIAILYESIQELKNMPKEIIVNEAVELTKKYCDADDYKFINGVLSQIG